MSEPPSEFDQSLQAVVDARQAHGAGSVAYDRAWGDFWRDHYAAFLKQAAAYACSKGLANHLHFLEEEIQERTLKRIASGKEINRKVLFGIRAKSIAEVREKVAHAEDQDYFARIVQRMRDGAIDEITHRELRTHLDEIIARVDEGHRSRLKGDILRVILSPTEDVYKLNGEINFAEVARVLDRPKGTVRRTWQELRLEVATLFPDLAVYLDIAPPVDAELYETFITKDPS